MKRLLLAIALFLLLTTSVRADTLFLPIIRVDHHITVTGQVRWRSGDQSFGPVAGYQLTLLEVMRENPPMFRHTATSPHARTDQWGRFAFQGVEDGRYVLGIEDRPPFGWAPVWQDTTLCLVVVEGRSVEMGTVRMGLGVEREDIEPR